MRLIFLAAALALTGCAPRPHQMLSCSAENAVYSLRGQPGAALSLVKTPHPISAASNLAARLTLDGGTWWFSFASSNGYSRDYLVPAPDPFKAEAGGPQSEETAEDDLSEFIAFDPGYNLLTGPPQAGQPAAAHILATGLGSSVWYSEPRRELRRAVWDLSACAKDGAL